ncbi:MAG: CDP-alcohol phosphatidyltransferase family protein [Beijerinckiaceae bacterium]
MTDPDPQPSSRRPLASRSSALARRALDWLLTTSITPNQISLLSIVAAGFGALCLIEGARQPLLFLLAAVFIQLRLLCNLLDGMMAVEGGRGSPVGALYNEVPDRIADTLLLVAWGYACGIGWLGWATALAAALTAYIRVLGGALGQPQDFRGPMAKQQRMALLTGACVVVMFETWLRGSGAVLGMGLWICLIGSVWTCAARLQAIAAGLSKG